MVTQQKPICLICGDDSAIAKVSAIYRSQRSEETIHTSGAASTPLYQVALGEGYRRYDVSGYAHTVTQSELAKLLTPLPEPGPSPESNTFWGLAALFGWVGTFVLAMLNRLPDSVLVAIFIVGLPCWITGAMMLQRAFMGQQMGCAKFLWREARQWRSAVGLRIWYEAAAP